MADENLTHDELWDDSALVTSWNDAFNEYKVRQVQPHHHAETIANSSPQKYHSLASRGEKVEEPKQPPTESLKEVAVETKAAAYLNGTTTTTTQPSSNAPINFTTEATPTATTTTTTPHTAAGPMLPNLPHTFLNGCKSLILLHLAQMPFVIANEYSTAQNEDLKNIMMSWYYAGYYTGLYEGQQKAWASIQEQQLAQQQEEQ